MEKRIKKLTLLALLPVVGLCGVATYAAFSGGNPLTIKAENKDYTLSFGTEKVKFEQFLNGLSSSSKKYSYRTSFNTELGNSIGFRVDGTDKVATSNLADDEIFRLEKADTMIYNTTAISGIKKISFTLASGVRTDGKVSVYFGFAQNDNMTQSYTFVNVPSKTYEVTFDQFYPSYFGLKASILKTGFSNVEITYTCNETTKLGKDVTVNNLNQLKEALAYHTHFDDKSSIVLGSDIGLTEYLYFKGESSPKPFNINLNGHTIKGLKKSEDSSSIFDDAKTEVSSINKSSTLLKIKPNANVTISGEGSVISNGTDTLVADMGDGYDSTSSSLTINNGNYVSGFDTDCLYINAGANSSSNTHKAGNIIINGGTFSNEGGERKMLLNIEDTTIEGTFIVNGGKFYDFNPANGDYGHTDSATDNKKSFVNDLYEVTSTVDGESKVYSVSKKTGEMALSSDVTLGAKLAYADANETVTINGNGKTLSVTSDFANNNALLINAKSDLVINDLTIDMKNAAGVWGIQAFGDITLNNVNIINVDHANEYMYTLNIYGGGTAKFVDCNIASATNMSTEDYGCADIWFGDGRTALIQGGTYGSIFVNASEESGLLHAGHLTIDASSDHVTKIEKVTLEGEVNKGHALVCEEKTYDKNTVYQSASITGNDSSDCTINTLVTNPQKYDLTKYIDLTGKTLSKVSE